MYNFCKIVQDLLPNYMEKTTSNETNAFIEEHLEQCEECTRVYNSMKSDIKVHTEDIEEGVDYMKKFNKEVKYLKFWKRILIIILLILALLSGIVMHRYFILSRLQELDEKTAEIIKNYHLTEETIEGGKTSSIKDVWKKGDISATKRIGSNGQESRVWQNGSTEEGYMIDVQKNKYYRMFEIVPMINFPPLSNFVPKSGYVLLDSEIKKSMLGTAINPRVSMDSIEYEGKQCYKIKESNNSFNDYSFDLETIFEKETGFVLYTCDGATKNEDGTYDKIEKKYKYEFGTVTDEDVEKPDLSQYEDITNENDKIPGNVNIIEH